MARRDTIGQTAWRVNIFRSDGSCYAGASFTSLDGALDYWNKVRVTLPGRQVFQKRDAGKQRFETGMERTVWGCPNHPDRATNSTTTNLCGDCLMGRPV